ncbi:hypothetical protein KC799_16785, partial [candidate division KSB1 bacterium]|nr:hypothetical protein [candidate division KSB1 bacterium]
MKKRRMCAKAIHFLHLFTLWLIVFNPLSISAADNGTFRGQEFYFAFLPNPISPLRLEINAIGEPGTRVNVQFANEPQQSGIIPSSGRLIFTINESAGKIENWQNSYNGQADNMAIHIVSDTDILCYAINGTRTSADGTVLLPIVELKTFYEVITYDRNDEVFERDQAVFAIVAPYDNTEIMVNPSQEISNQIAQNSNGTYSIILNKNEAFLLRSQNFGQEGNLSGTIVKSNFPVAIINGNRCTRIPSGIPSCDHIFEMAQPIQSWGKEVLVAGSPNRPSGMSYEIVALHPNTEVAIDGRKIGTIDNTNRSIKLDTLRGAHIITAENPIFVSQFMPGSVTINDVQGDPNMTNITPVQQFVPTHKFITPDASSTNPLFLTNQITLYVHKNDIANVQVDNIRLGSSLFEPIPGTSFYTATMPISPGVHTSQTLSEDHGLIVSGYGNGNSYAYPAGDSLVIINKGHDNRAPQITSELINHAAHGTARDDSLSEDSNNNGLLDVGEDLNNNNKMDEDYGLAEVFLEAGSENVTFTFTSLFNPGVDTVAFEVRLIDQTLPGRGTVVAIDLSGNETKKEIVIPECHVFLLNPSVVNATLADSVFLSIFPGFKGDDPKDYTKTLRITNEVIEATYDFIPNTAIDIPVKLHSGINEITIRTDYLSQQAQWTSCDTSFEITRVVPLACSNLQFNSPHDPNILNETGHFSVSVNLTGGYKPTTSCVFINTTTGDTLPAVVVNGYFEQDIPLAMGSNVIKAVTTTTDIVPHSAVCSEEIEVFRPFPFECSIRNVTPTGGFATISDSIDIAALIEINGGIAPYQDSIFINDTPVVWKNGAIGEKMSLQFGDNTFTIHAAFRDAYDQPTECKTTLTVYRPSPLECAITNTSHPDGFETLDSLITFEASLQISGGFPPIKRSAYINDDEIAIIDNKISKKIALNFGFNEVAIKTFFSDSLGQATHCDTTITIHRPFPLSCDISWINQENQSVTLDSSIHLKAFIPSQGGLPPLTAYALVNGDSIPIVNDTLDCVVNLAYKLNEIIVKAHIADKLNQQTQCDTIFYINRVTPPQCSITSFFAESGAATLDATTRIHAEIAVSGGLRPIISSAQINGNPVSIDEGRINTEVPLQYGENEFEIRSISTDAMGQETICDSTLIVKRVKPLACEIVNLSHQNGMWTAASIIDFAAFVQVNDGMAPIARSAMINGETVDFAGDSIAKQIELIFGQNEIQVRTSFEDAFQQTTSCDTTIVINRATPLQCAITEFSPENDFETSHDSITVAARVKTNGGLSPILTHATLNDQPVDINEGIIQHTIALNFDANEITLHTNFIDSLGQTTKCDTIVTIFRKDPPACEIVDVSPVSGTNTAEGSIEFSAQIKTRGGVPPIGSSATINGESVDIVDGFIKKNIALETGENTITLQTSFNDSRGQSAQCDTTIFLYRPAPPTCFYDGIFPQNGYSTQNKSILFEANIHGKSDVRIAKNTVWLNDELLGTNIFAISQIIDIPFGHNEIKLTSEYVDELGQTSRCDTLIQVFRIPPPLTCSITKVIPGTNYVTADSLLSVEATANTTGGLPEIEAIALINDQEVPINKDGRFSRNIDLAPGENTIAIRVIFHDSSPDSLLQTTQCDTTIKVIRVANPECHITNVLPLDSSVTSNTQIIFSASVGVRGGAEPVNGTATINGEPVEIIDGKVNKVIDLEIGANNIDLQTSWADAIGQTVSCDTKITVIRVTQPECYITDVLPLDSTKTSEGQITFSASVGVRGGAEPV